MGCLVREKTVISAVRRYFLPMLVLIFVGLVLLLCGRRVQTEFPELRPEDGVADLREADFTHNVYHLVNSWAYYPGVLYTPEDFADPETAPEKDDDAPLDPVKGTWRLRLLAEPDTYLCMCHFSIDYSTRIFVNGKELRNIGFVSDNPDEAVPQGRYLTLPLYFGESGEVELVYQYTNYWHNDGGFIQSTTISTPENIDDYQRGLTLYYLLLSSGLLFLMFYFLLCGSIQRRWEYAALALCCLVMALRNQFFFSEHLLPADLSFNLLYRLSVLDVSWIPAAALLLLAAFYPNASGKRTLWLMGGILLMLSALHFLVPLRQLVLLCHICYYVCVPFLVWLVWRLIRYFLK